MKRFCAMCLGLIGLLIGHDDASGASWQGGFRLGLLHPHTELSDEPDGVGYGFLRVGFHRLWQAELGGGYGRLKGGDYSTDLWLGDIKLRLQPVRWDVFSPFLFGGIGAMHHRIHQLPALRTPDSDASGWTVALPVGLGFQAALSEHVRLEVAGGYTYTYRDDLNGAILIKGNDAFFDWTAGLVFGRFDAPKKKAQSKEQTPVPKAATRLDTDADGLTDVEERDFYKTNPELPDSDGDGLTDFEEVRQFFTNPNAADSDGDGLTDGEEMRVYQTNAHVADTDGDGLIDGLEVSKYMSDPTKADTDMGGVPDGQEVLNGTYVLDPEDDVRRSPAAEHEKHEK